MSMDNVKKTLELKANQIGKATEILVSKTRDWQVIKEYMNNRLGKMQLTKMQQDKLERYQYIYNQLIGGKYSETEVVYQVTNFFKISITQAYEDLNCSQEVFLTVLNINKRFEMKVELASARAIKRKCEEIGDYKALAAIQKNIINLLKELKDEEETQSDLFEGHTIEPTFDPRLLGAPDIDMKAVLQAINAKRGKKINIDMFEDIAHEEVSND